jgi:hypothetical protein
VSSNMPAQKVKAVCFDVGNVLVEIDIAYAIARLGLPVDDRLSQKIQAIGQWATYDAFERGHMREAQFLHALQRVVRFSTAPNWRGICGAQH